MDTNLIYKIIYIDPIPDNKYLVLVDKYCHKTNSWGKQGGNYYTIHDLEKIIPYSTNSKQYKYLLQNFKQLSIYDY